MPAEQKTDFPIELQNQVRLSEIAGQMVPQEAHWYATYTCSRQEKQIAKLMEVQGLTCFLPLYQKLRRHNRGTRRVFLPLFPGYLFVQICPSERVRVLEVPGIVRFISFHGQPAIVEDAEIQSIQKALALNRSAHPCQYVKIGQTALIESGPLQGLRGKLLRSNNKFRAVLSVEVLQRSFIVDVDERDLAFVPQPVRPAHAPRYNAA